MTAAAEVAALRGIARRLGSSDRPIEPRQARAWSSAIQSCAGNLARAVEHLSAEIAGRKPVEPPPVPPGATGYEGLSIDEAAQRYASRASAIAVRGAPAAELLVERGRFVAAVAAYAPVSASQPSAGTGTPGNAEDGARGRRDARRREAMQALPRAGSQRRRVLDAVVAVARNPTIVGLTDVQLAHATGLPANTVRPRRVELVTGGWLEPAQTTREHHGREHTVWVLTQKAVAAGELWSPPVGEPARA